MTLEDPLGGRLGRNLLFLESCHWARRLVTRRVVIPCHQDFVPPTSPNPKAGSRCGGAASREPFTATFSSLHLRSNGIPLFTSSNLFNSLFIVVRIARSKSDLANWRGSLSSLTPLIPGQLTPHFLDSWHSSTAVASSTHQQRCEVLPRKHSLSAASTVRELIGNLVPTGHSSALRPDRSRTVVFRLDHDWTTPQHLPFDDLDTSFEPSSRELSKIKGPSAIHLLHLEAPA